MESLRSTLVCLAVLSMLIAAAPTLAVEIDVDDRSTSYLENVSLSRLPTVDDSLMYQLEFEVESLARFHLEEIFVEYEVIHATGYVIGGGGFLVTALAAGERKALSVNTTLGGLELGEEDTLRLRTRAMEPQKSIDTCTRYCDLCSERAAALCLNGTQSYSCSCTEGGSRSCNFSCFPPPR